MTAELTTPATAGIVADLVDLLGESQVEVDPDAIRAASVDRFKKYTAVHGIFDGPFPAAIVRARSTDDVRAVLTYADAHGLNVVPRTGGTATEGGLETAVADSIVLDCSPMDAILSIDPVDMQATVQCGVGLQRLEDELRAQGLTTGHSPQSKPIAQMGGLVATRSIGQLSTLYGGIEDMVVGLEAVFPDGTVARIKNVPRRAAGPDLRHVVIGNEGALCVVTEVTVKVFRAPEALEFRGYLIDDFAAGIEILREVVVGGYRPSVARAYSPGDAQQHFSHLPGFDAERTSVVVLVAEGPRRLVEATAAGIDDAVARCAEEHRVTPVEQGLVEEWFTHLNWGPDKIEAEKAAMLREAHLGYTTEVSASWSAVPALYDNVMRRVREEFPRAGDLTMLGAHSSHSYQTGTNLYFVYDYDITCEPREEIDLYHRPLNAIVVEEALAVGGSMVHHHGIGKYRTEWTREEHGSAYPILAGLKRTFDPNGTMNAGTIFPLGDDL
ncbi:FAD-binding oxidoreductase [Nocardioides sp. CFH 31398]|uniref:FAD-binding oxidoreductase n=1 Tax=Nocardioides sp. CFH 31398 TaxID=2919579 RepID=UPI001F0677A4|nr:FAD-binding oxidoreductase [Nocardioides sp. CFH 31398]MCH1866057.1 FAD-binding oxidoreductase [Nocardioides sp. CFH 31398]